MEHQDLDRRIISVEHLTIRSKKAFEEVKSKLETLVPRIDDGIFTLLRYGEVERALRELEASPPLMIFGSRNHGALLAVAGLQRRSVQYDIGNPLTASMMTRHQISAGLYAPVRVLLREAAEGDVAFEFDRPLSLFGQFQDGDVDPVARQLDENLRSVLQQAAS
ncbi:MAG: DUF302 domain-containing protein [Acetobacteraceae bacterium]|nr:DUF302 domain-containing protein [Acetobacteraceae bacterium]